MIKFLETLAAKYSDDSHITDHMTAHLLEVTREKASSVLENKL